MVASALAGCSSSLLTAGLPPGSLPEMVRQAQQQQQARAPTSREHQRILAAYNGAYEDPKLEGMLNQIVAKLVAASERPEVHYRVTILNSASINAFALPSGQLYVTRGLIALANVHDRAVERFRVLNGLGPSERVNPGDQVKIVVE